MSLALAGGFFTIAPIREACDFLFIWASMCIHIGIYRVLMLPFLCLESIPSVTGQSPSPELVNLVKYTGRGRSLQFCFKALLLGDRKQWKLSLNQ